MGENREKWTKLCEQAADEQDPKKLAARTTDRQGSYRSTYRRSRTLRTFLNMVQNSAVPTTKLHPSAES